MQTVSVFKTVMKREDHPVDVDRDDLISISEAADLRGVKIPTILYLMGVGDLPTYQFLTDPSGEKRIPKYTSRHAVEALPKVKGDKVKNTLRKVYSSENSPYPRIKLALTSIFAPRRAFALQ